MSVSVSVPGVLSCLVPVLVYEVPVMPPLLAGELTTAQMGGQGSPHRDNFVSGIPRPFLALWKPDAGGMCVSLICVNFTLNSLYYDDVLSLFSLLFVGFSIFQNCRPSRLYQVWLPRPLMAVDRFLCLYIGNWLSQFGVEDSGWDYRVASRSTLMLSFNHGYDSTS